MLGVTGGDGRVSHTGDAKEFKEKNKALHDITQDMGKIYLYK